MELVGCQTCENCYHAECMTPSLDATTVPTYWFCPHCVERDFHIPPVDAQTNDLSRTSTHVKNGTLGESQQEFSESINHSQVNNLVNGGHPENKNQCEDLRVKLYPTISSSQKLPEQRGMPVKTPSQLIGSKRAAIGPTKVSLSPPRKKSKYSIFSSEVDKALSVIHSQLETAATCASAEDGLRSKIKDLEQQLKVQEGQMQLLRNESSNERLKNKRLGEENIDLRNDVTKLRELVENKDAELSGWQTKLRSLLKTDID